MTSSSNVSKWVLIMMSNCWSDTSFINEIFSVNMEMGYVWELCDFNAQILCKCWWIKYSLIKSCFNSFFVWFLCYWHSICQKECHQRKHVVWWQHVRPQVGLPSPLSNVNKLQIVCFSRTLLQLECFEWKFVWKQWKTPGCGKKVSVATINNKI